MTVYSIMDPDTFALAATIKGHLPANDNDEYIDHLVFRVRSWHALDRGALRDHAVEFLDRFGREPDDEMIFELAAEWSDELNKARLISALLSDGRRVPSHRPRHLLPRPCRRVDPEGR